MQKTGTQNDPLGTADVFSLHSIPCFVGVLATKKVIYGVLLQTWAWSCPVLDSQVGSQVVVKHENVQPIGAFKVTWRARAYVATY
ncbi:hypothetical protein BPY_14170 [Bifidobacterium psychraerophilum]